MSGTVYSGTGTSYGADGNIYGGAMSSSSGAPTTGRPPQIGRNSIYMPGLQQLRLPHLSQHPHPREHLHADLRGCLQPSQPPDHHRSQRHLLAVPRERHHLGIGSTQLKCNATTPAPGATFQGCISPYSGTGLSAFGVTSGTNNSLYGARQMQFAAKLFF